MKVRIHRDAKPGSLLKYSDGALHYVSPSGARVNVIRNPDGSVSRAPKPLTKKQRRRAVAA